jgi:cation diffusion facilitator family transporter
MVTLLSKLMLKNQELGTPAGRRAYGVLCSAVGIGLNVLLFAVKLAAGLLSGSIAILSDAFNNLSDAGSSVITLLCFRLAGQKPDREHPFGHGRFEYISGLVVSMLVLMVGADLLKASAGRLITPQEPSFSMVSICILAVSIAVKLYMAWYNRRAWRETGSSAMLATSVDSLSDAAATSAVLASLAVFRLTGINMDGWIGILVAGFIIKSGIEAAAETINPLLGKAPDPEYVEEIKKRVMAFPGVSDVHKILVHDYGPGRQFVTLHVEMSQDFDFEHAHSLAEEMMLALGNEFDCEALIHMEPMGAEDLS